MTNMTDMTLAEAIAEVQALQREVKVSDALLLAEAKVSLDRLAGAEAAEAEIARLRDVLVSAASHLWFAANKMKGRCNGSDVSAISMAHDNARAALATKPAAKGGANA